MVTGIWAASVRALAGGMLVALSAMGAAHAQRGSPDAARLSEAQTRLPGMTWQSLAALPQFIGSRWVPDDAPQSERAYLRTATYPPLKPEYLADARVQVREILAGKRKPPAESCAFDGMPRLAWYPYPLQFLYASGYVMIQAHDVIRAVPVGGVQHAASLLDPDQLQGFSIHGDAAGIWAGRTLVVDIVGVREDMDTFYGVPNDPGIHIIERYRLLESGKLERTTTIESPEYFTRPWHVVTTFHRAPEGPWATQFCLPARPKGHQ